MTSKDDRETLMETAPGLCRAAVSPSHRSGAGAAFGSPDLLAEVSDILAVTERLNGALNEDRYDEVEELVNLRGQALDRLRSIAGWDGSRDGRKCVVEPELRRSIGQLERASNHLCRLVVEKKSGILSQLVTLQRRVSGQLYK